MLVLHASVCHAARKAGLPACAAAGARFTLSIYTAQRDEARCLEPDTFRPKRFLTVNAMQLLRLGYL